MEKKEYSTQNRKMSLGQAMRACITTAHADYASQQQPYIGFTMYPIKCNPSEDGKKLFCKLNIRDEFGNKGVPRGAKFSNDAIAHGEFVIDTKTGDVDIINLSVGAELDNYDYDEVKRDVLNEQNKNNGGE